MKKKNEGFSLIELIIVVAIIGIITAFALPSYNNSVMEGRRSDGHALLLDAASRMETFFYENREYAATTAELGYTSPSSLEGYYELSVIAETSSCPISSCYVLQATALGAQVSDGNLTINSLGQRLPTDRW